MISRQRRAWPYGSEGGSAPSGMTGAVPATETVPPTRTAREYPTVAAIGDTAGTRRRSPDLVSPHGGAASGRRVGRPERGGPGRPARGGAPGRRRPPARVSGTT